MITVAIITRRLREGKTYDDFRKAWFHTTGFGTFSKLHTMLNVNDPREITVIGFVEMSMDDATAQLEMDVKERLSHSLDEIIEPEIERRFGILISEDDFSAEGNIDYKPASINGKTIDVEEVSSGLSQLGEAIKEASGKRDRSKQARA